MILFWIYWVNYKILEFTSLSFYPPRNFLKLHILGRPWWSSGQDSVLPMQGYSFNPIQRSKIPHVM